MQDLKAVLSDRELQKTLRTKFVGVWEKHMSCAMRMLRTNMLAGAHIRILDHRGKKLAHYDYGFGKMVGGELQKKYWEGRIRKIKKLIQKALPKPSKRKWY